jgi:aspartate kinase
VHDFPALRSDLAALGASVREDVGAVSAIGAGINADFRTVRRCLEVMSSHGMDVLGLSTSSFRVSILTNEHHVSAAARHLHAALCAPD